MASDPAAVAPELTDDERIALEILARREQRRSRAAVTVMVLVAIAAVVGILIFAFILGLAVGVFDRGLHLVQEIL